MFCKQFALNKQSTKNKGLRINKLTEAPLKLSMNLLIVLTYFLRAIADDHLYLLIYFKKLNKNHLKITGIAHMTLATFFE